MCDDVHCGPHYRAAQSKSHYTSAITIYHNQCSESSTGCLHSTARTSCPLLPLFSKSYSWILTVHQNGDPWCHPTCNWPLQSIQYATQDAPFPKATPIQVLLACFSATDEKMHFNNRAGTSDRLNQIADLRIPKNVEIHTKSPLNATIRILTNPKAKLTWATFDTIFSLS